MSNINKQALRERYSPQPVPKCHICGTEMTMQRMSGSRIKYGCSGAIYDDAGCHYAEGRSIADDHYEQSCVTIVDVSDPDVLALLDELEAKDRRNAELNSTLERWAVDRAQSASELEAAERRIAEFDQRIRTQNRHACELFDEAKTQRQRVAELEARDNAEHELFLRAKALMYQSGGSPIENSLNPINAWLYDAERAAGIRIGGEG